MPGAPNQQSSELETGRIALSESTSWRTCNPNAARCQWHYLVTALFCEQLSRIGCGDSDACASTMRAVSCLLWQSITLCDCRLRRSVAAPIFPSGWSFTDLHRPCPRVDNAQPWQRVVVLSRLYLFAVWPRQWPSVQFQSW
jgi:hypothetical protein